MTIVKFKNQTLDRAFSATLTFVETWKRKRKADPYPDNPIKGVTGIDTRLHELQSRQLVSRLRNYVLKDRYYAKPDINRDELILALSTNRTTLSEAVRAVTNNTLMGYLNVLRLEEAKRMLDTHPKLTIETIAEKCGFNLRTFYRLFNERYHLTPAKYRIINTIDDMA